MTNAIETKYAGYLFRSRLEARWAVFFDTLGVEWRYECEGFKNEYGDHYLPDFYLPGSKTWVEVKGDPNALVKDKDRMIRLLDFGGVLPDFGDSYGSLRGLVLLGDIPRDQGFGLYLHPIIQHHKGLQRNWGIFAGKTGWNTLNIGLVLQHCITGTHGNCIECGPESEWVVETVFLPTRQAWSATIDAYHVTRQARFEHGENGAVRA